mmetsp:Transcript_30554/g.46287  ORF Transcript_30554/g.46287 Transcript_30554/m.46287 type:complete len:242 (-) Transcript_30554:25-750(-)
MTPSPIIHQDSTDGRMIRNSSYECGIENVPENFQSNTNFVCRVSNEQFENYPTDDIALLVLEQALPSSHFQRQRFHTTPDSILLSFQESAEKTRAANSSDEISTTTPRTRRRGFQSNRTRRILCIFRSLLVLATVIVYLFLEDTASQAAGPLPPQPLPIFQKPNHVSMYQLNHARSWEAPEFKVKDRPASSRNELSSILKLWGKSNLSWIWCFLIVGIVAEWLWSNIILRRAYTGINDRTL